VRGPPVALKREAPNNMSALPQLSRSQSLDLDTTSAAIASAPKPRVDWIDHAKGICIFFVVMLHVNDLVQEQFGAKSWLDQVVTFARPFRMPDFFLIAGLFLASSLRKPWRVYADKKVIHFFYFYVLWMTLNFAAFDLRHVHDQGGNIGVEYLRRFIDPTGPLWFIYILPIFFVVTRVTRSLPWWLIGGGAALLHVTQLDTGWEVPDQFAARYVFFYSGYMLAPQIFRIAAWARERIGAAIGYLLVWGVVNGVVVASGVAGTPYASLPLGYAGALAVIFTAVLLSTGTWTRPLRYAGENSIIIYLGDAIISTLVARLLLSFAIDTGALALVVTLLTIAGCLGAWRILVRTPAAFLYRRPRWLRL